jgi:glycine cleavage system H protein
LAQPQDLLYSKEHEWAKLDGETATIGITDYAQESLGDIVYVELPKIGAEIEQFFNVGVIESVKAVSDLFTPLSGKVVEINETLDGDASRTAPVGSSNSICGIGKRKNACSLQPITKGRGLLAFVEETQRQQAVRQRGARSQRRGDVNRLGQLFTRRAGLLRVLRVHVEAVWALRREGDAERDQFSILQGHRTVGAADRFVECDKTVKPWPVQLFELGQ